MLTLGKRADLDYSTYLGSPTRYSLEDVALCCSDIVGLNSFNMHDNQRTSEILNSQLLGNLSPELQALLIDITTLGGLLNETTVGHRPKLDGRSFHGTLVLIGYRLVSLYPLAETRPTNRLENAIHLGLVAFIVTLLRGLDRRIMETPILSELARSVAQEPFDNEQENQEVLLWLLFIGGASIFKPPVDAWLISKTVQAMHSLGLHSWEDICQVLAKFPWVWALHNKAGKWHRPTSCCENSTKITYE